MDPVAASGFGADPERYDRGRPSYPQPAVDWMLDELGIHPGARVVDLAAGTGKMTRLLATRGFDLVAVEPVEAMATVLRRHLPDIPLIMAPAEDLPFDDAGIDAVVVAQAFHWFDPDAAWAELARIIRPGGGVGLMWNVRDRSVPWIDAVWSVMDSVEKRAPWRDHEGDPLDGLRNRPGFGALRDAEFDHVHSSDLDAFLDRFASVSHVAVLAEETRSRIIADVKSILDDHPEAFDGSTLQVPYRTEVYVSTRRTGV